jgi:hypothetical protein
VGRIAERPMTVVDRVTAAAGWVRTEGISVRLRPGLGTTVVRASRVAALVATGLLLLWAAAVLATVYQAALVRHEVGWDAVLYREFAHHWLDTGAFYSGVQLTGPYEGVWVVNLYPPVALYLLAPLSVLPLEAWWVIPLGVLIWHIVTARPAWWCWPILAWCAGSLTAGYGLVYGDSDLWIVALLALACRMPAAAWLLVIKPSVLPLALLFAPRRAWWLAVPLVLVLLIPFGHLWADWAVAVQNVRGRPTLLYSVQSWPVYLIPLLAWWCRDRRATYPGAAAPSGRSTPTRAA